MFKFEEPTTTIRPNIDDFRLEEPVTFEESTAADIKVNYLVETKHQEITLKLDKIIELLTEIKKLLSPVEINAEQDCTHVIEAINSFE